MIIYSVDEYCVYFYNKNLSKQKLKTYLKQKFKYRPRNMIGILILL